MSTLIPNNADIVIVQHRWRDANNNFRGVQADVTWTPITNSGDQLTPNLVDVAARGWVKTRTWTSRPDRWSGYMAVPLVATNDPDLTSLAGFAGYRVQAAGETPFTITVDHDVDEVAATTEMSQALAQLEPPVSVAPGDMVRAVWLTDLAQITPPQPPSLYYTAAQTTSLVLDTVGVHDDDPDAHPAIRALVQGGVADATTTTKGKARIHDGTADDPRYPWNKVTGAPASLPPSGGAGGVLSGSYPSPGFAQDMATQAEADAGDAASVATAAADAAAKVNTHRTASDPHGDRAWASGQFAPASLFVDGVLTTAALPAVAISETYPVASQAAMLALAAQRGDMARRTDQGGALYWLAADPATTLTNWLPIDVHGEVQSVNGQAGTVVLGASDVGADPAGAAATARSQAATDATNKVAAHSVAADPHGDRAYADGGDAGRQPLDADLTAIAALNPADGALLGRQSGTWVGRTPTQARGDIGAAAATHGHAVGDVTGLQSALDGKAAVGHTHSGGGGSTSSEQVFTASGTWTKPTGCTFVEVWLWAGGGGGGSGARQPAGTASSGGAGGTGAPMATVRLPASALPSTVAVTVGEGGPGAASVTTDSSLGVGGTRGNPSSFGSYAFARSWFGGGAGAGGGGITSGVARSGGYSGAAATLTALGGEAYAGQGGGTGVASFGLEASGGGSGAGVGSGGQVFAGGQAGRMTLLAQDAGPSGGASGGGSGTAGVALADRRAGGVGGGGGGSTTSAASGAGGAGAQPGGGGGGGAASVNGQPSGAGGAGGAGLVVVFAW